MAWRLTYIVLSLMVILVVSPQIGQMQEADGEIIFGLILTGARDDGGWNQALFEGGQFVENAVAGAQMRVFDRLNPVDDPVNDFSSVAQDMIDDGAIVLFVGSPELEAQVEQLAGDYVGQVVFVIVGGDNVLTGQAPGNVGNLMIQMEWGKLIAGCAAGISTQRGIVGYLGGENTAEARRFASSTYLGARYCYERYNTFAGEDDALSFHLNWLNRSDATRNEMSLGTGAIFNEGADVVMTGIANPSLLQVARERQVPGQQSLVIDVHDSTRCDEFPRRCLGTLIYNWGPSMSDQLEAVVAETWAPSWVWVPPTWNALDDPDQTPFLFLPGGALTTFNFDRLQNFVGDLESYATNPFVPRNEFGMPGFALWSGPLNLQGDVVLVAPGQVADALDVWYLPQSLAGIELVGEQSPLGTTGQ